MSNCQGLGRKNKFEISKTDRMCLCYMLICANYILVSSDIELTVDFRNFIVFFWAETLAHWNPTSCQKKHPRWICSDLRLGLTIRRLKLWKPTVNMICCATFARRGPKRRLGFRVLGLSDGPAASYCYLLLYYWYMLPLTYSLICIAYCELPIITCYLMPTTCYYSL